MTRELPPGYTIRELTPEEFQPLWRIHAEKIFDEESTTFRVFPSLTEPEQESWRALGKNMGTPYNLRLGIYKGEEFVGWHCGDQKDAQTYYMRNSAILPEHRRKGLYSALLEETLRRV